MRVRARLFASFREAVGNGDLSLEVPEGASAAQIVDQLRETYPSLGPTVERAMLAVNQEYVGPGYRLHDGDELALIPPVSGG